MHGMSKDEYNELRNKILELAHESLNTIDFHYLHGKSYTYTLYHTLEHLSESVDSLKQEFYLVHEAEKTH